MKATAKQLVEAGLTCNGVVVSASDKHLRCWQRLKGAYLSVLAKLKVIRVVGQVKSESGKGKPANIYEVGIFGEDATNWPCEFSLRD